MSLRTRIEALERVARRVYPGRQLDLFIQALAGDSAALEELRQLRRQRIIAGHLDELVDAVLIPLQADTKGVEESAENA